MPRSRHAKAPEPLEVRRSRHGRGTRGPITGPHLPMLHNRIDRFEVTVASTADYLAGIWPDDLADVRIAVASAPAAPAGPEGMPRWNVDREHRRIVFYRVPIQRTAAVHDEDEFHRRMYVESCVFRAVAEYLGRDPWDLADGVD